MKDNMNSKKEQLIALRQEGSPAQHRGYWTDGERQKLQDLFEEGVGISDMALIFHRSEGAIFNQLETMKLFKKARRTREKSIECKCSKCQCKDCDKFSMRSES